MKELGFSDQQLRELAARVRWRAVKAGEYLIQMGSVANLYFRLEEGEVKVVVNGNEVARLGKGSHFGEQSLLGDKKRCGASVVAVTKCNVLEMPRAVFTEIRSMVQSNVEQEHRTERDRSQAYIQTARSVLHQIATQETGPDA